MTNDLARRIRRRLSEHPLSETTAGALHFAAGVDVVSSRLRAGAAARCTALFFRASKRFCQARVALRVVIRPSAALGDPND
jgi:hypothetical protein